MGDGLGLGEKEEKMERSCWSVGAVFCYAAVLRQGYKNKSDTKAGIKSILFTLQNVLIPYSYRS